MTALAGSRAFGILALRLVACWVFLFAVLGIIRAGDMYGIDAIVDEQPTVKRTPTLRYVLG